VDELAVVTSAALYISFEVKEFEKKIIHTKKETKDL
jgi:hypothetical protein